jgi:hypothetical protein
VPWRPWCTDARYDSRIRVDAYFGRHAQSFTDIARRFIRICADLDVSNSIYASYRLVSSALHPGFFTSALYTRDDGGAYLTVSKLSDESSTGSVIPLLAHSLIWAGSTLDSLMLDHPRLEQLERLADEINCAVTLPARRGDVITS